MMAHPVALQLRNLQSLVEIGVDKNTTVVFPAPIMSTIEELGSFMSREREATNGVAGTPSAPATTSRVKARARLTADEQVSPEPTGS